MDVFLYLGLIMVTVVKDGLCVSDCFIYINGFSIYNGTVSVTETGKTCQRWDVSTPHTTIYPMNSEHSNYCRDPSGWPNLWCYTTDPNTRWEDCDVPNCAANTTVPNRNDTLNSTTKEITSSNFYLMNESTEVVTTPNFNYDLNGNYSTITNKIFSTTARNVTSADVCMCNCDTRSQYWWQYYYGNLTQEEKHSMIEAEKQRLIHELTVPKKNLSSI